MSPYRAAGEPENITLQKELTKLTLERDAAVLAHEQADREADAAHAQLLDAVRKLKLAAVPDKPLRVHVAAGYGALIAGLAGNVVILLLEISPALYSIFALLGFVFGAFVGTQAPRLRLAVTEDDLSVVRRKLRLLRPKDEM